MGWTVGLRAKPSRSSKDGDSTIALKSGERSDHAPATRPCGGLCPAQQVYRQDIIQKDQNFTGVIGQHHMQDTSSGQGVPASLADGPDGSLAAMVTRETELTLNEILGEHVCVTPRGDPGSFWSLHTPLPYVGSVICRGFSNQLTRLVRTVFWVRVSVLSGSLYPASAPGSVRTWNVWYFCVIREKKQPFTIMGSLLNV